ncbi:DotU family type IV/VI secretion system protein [Paraburkholderia sp. MMS20-SJTR3]|uniref:DotU family type IV/VI secretion system protein n=1 Tax=Paraburkholderia sejongensis TaxID=2886946 RepID=A0ABS8JRF2_9BURK|nr:DotU family type IV/VI secretion system protein [Paraburkholderia sp. MMS20-SJTR3]MCC8392447.1 DotU family type IV/VI secretion system protein [Paraburkholderia sp. MMS20-SJTR3]
MTIPKSIRSGHRSAALTGTAPAADHSIGEGIRDLLRDTALLVTSLAAGGTVQDATAFRERCRQLITSFSEALARRGYPDDVRLEATVAQCGLLDETALRELEEQARSGWELKPLQVELFKLHDAGERVIDCIEARLREAPPNVDLLECYSVILGMGFIGRYARDGDAKRVELIGTLNTRLQKLHPAIERPFIADRPGRRLSDWLYRLSPWAIAALACVVAVAVWGVWNVALDAQLADITSAKVGRQ